MNVAQPGVPVFLPPAAVAAALLLVIGLAGCPGVPEPAPEEAFLGRWMMDSGGIVATYWFYDDLTMHRESTVLGFTTDDAGYFSATATTLSVHAIGKAPEIYTYTIEGTTLTLTDPDTGSLSFEKQATLDKPANNAPSVEIDGGDAMVIPGSPVSFTVTVDDPDPSPDLTYQWYVDNDPQDGETAATFTFNVPGTGAAFTVTVVVSDGFDVAAFSSALTALHESSTVFEQWNGSSWASTGISVPEGTLDAFSYDGNLAVRFANNDLWTYTGGAWADLGVSAPAGTIHATGVDSSSASLHYLLARDADGICWVYPGATPWTPSSDLDYPPIPSSAVDFGLLGSNLMDVSASGTIRFSPGGSVPFADLGNPGSPTEEAVRLIGVGDYGATPVLWAVTESGELWTGDDDVPPAWVDTGVSIPSAAIDVFMNGGSVTIRR